MKVTALSCAVVCLLALMFLGVNSLIDRSICAYYGKQTERQVRYAAFVGCMVKTNNGWTPRAEIRSAAE